METSSQLVSPFDDGTQVFIVRVWREAREIPGAQPEWRGVVEHVPSGERRFFKELEEIIRFMSSYVPHMPHGVCSEVGNEEDKP